MIPDSRKSKIKRDSKEELEDLFQQFYNEESKRDEFSTTLEIEKRTWKLRGSKDWNSGLWFELLSDVAILVALFKMSLENPFDTVEDGLRVVAKFLFVWQIWYGQVMLMSLYDTDYALFKILQLLQVTIISVTGITRPFANTNEQAYTAFVLTIIISKVILLGQLCISLHTHGLKQLKYQLGWIISILVEIVLWSISFHFKTAENGDFNSNIWLWRMGVLIELVLSTLCLCKNPLLNRHFINDRFSLLTVAMFGKMWFGISVFLQDFTTDALWIVICHIVISFMLWRTYYFSSKFYDITKCFSFNLSWISSIFCIHLSLFIGTSAVYDILIKEQSVREMKIEICCFCIVLLVLAFVNALGMDYKRRLTMIFGKIVVAFVMIFVVFSVSISSYREYIVILVVLSALTSVLVLFEWSFQNHSDILPAKHDSC